MIRWLKPIQGPPVELDLGGKKNFLQTIVVNLRKTANNGLKSLVIKTKHLFRPTDLLSRPNKTQAVV